MMKISEVIKETGLTRKAIYYYEEIGLINPCKEDDRSYRDYSDGDVERLKQIRALRLLDVSLSKIKNIFDTPTAFNDVMEEQLKIIKEKVQLLNENEKVIKSLLEHNTLKSPFCNLDRLNHYLDSSAKKSKDYMKKELERIFPSGFGKLIAFMYGAFLDEPIDTKEKEQAWNNLVITLDSTKTIPFPDEIKDIINHLYEQILQEGMDQFEVRMQKIINNVHSVSTNLTEEEKEEIKSRIQEAQKQEGFTEMYEMNHKLFEYIKGNPTMLPSDFSKYMKVLSPKFNDFSNNLRENAKSKYHLAKMFDTNG